MSRQYDPLLAQSARVLETMRLLSDQYGEQISAEAPMLADALADCAQALNRFLLDQEPRGQAELMQQNG